MKSQSILLIPVAAILHLTSALSAQDSLPPEQWTGHRFVILTKPLDQQRYGYSCLRHSDGGYIIPSYEECAGKVGTVTKVVPPEHPGSDMHVFLTLENSDEVYEAIGSPESIPCLAFAADLDTARARWQGKTVWVKWPVYLLHPGGNHVRTQDSVAKFSAMRVDSVQAGYTPEQPVRLILSQDGQTYWADFRIGKVNMKSNAAGYVFSDILFAQDPHTVYSWEQGIWTSLERGEVSRGMTTEQVVLSWGRPEAITSLDSKHCRCEDWEYGPTTLHFRDGTLDSVEDE